MSIWNAIVIPCKFQNKYKYTTMYPKFLQIIRSLYCLD